MNKKRIAKERLENLAKAGVKLLTFEHRELTILLDENKTIIIPSVCLMPDIGEEYIQLIPDAGESRANMERGQLHVKRSSSFRDFPYRLELSDGSVYEIYPQAPKDPDLRERMVCEGVTHINLTNSFY